MEKYCMVDQPLNSFENTELDYLAQVLFALLFTCSDTHQLDDIKKKPNPTKQRIINRCFVINK